MVQEVHKISLVVLSIVVGIASLFVITVTFMVMAKPYWTVFDSLNSTIYGFTGGTGTLWSEWNTNRSFFIMAFGISAVILIMAVFALVYLRASRKERWAEVY